MILTVFYLFIVFLLFVFLVIFSIYTLFLIYSSIKGSPFVGTDKKLIKKILEEAKLKKNKIFYDLGCGDGRVIISAVKNYQVKGIGVDVNPILLKIALLNSQILHLNKKKIQFIRDDICRINFRNADYIYLFLMPQLINKLKPKLEKLKKGTIIISHGFKIEGWENKLVKKLTNNPFSTYYYKVK